MALSWIHEQGPARWDEGKERIVGGAPTGIFDFRGYGPGDLVPGTWWRVEDDGETVGYGWMDVVWGDAQIQLAVDPSRRRRGVGAFILDRLEQEAGRQGLCYLFNVVAPAHPEAAAVTRWLGARGFAGAGEDRLLRRRVGKG